MVEVVALIGLGAMLWALVVINGRSKRALSNTEETKVAAAATAMSVEKIHVAVNSERTAMTDEIRKLRNEILLLSTDKARLDQWASDKENKP